MTTHIVDGRTWPYNKGQYMTVIPDDAILSLNCSPLQLNSLTSSSSQCRGRLLSPSRVAHSQLHVFRICLSSLHSAHSCSGCQHACKNICQWKSCSHEHACYGSPALDIVASSMSRPCLHLFGFDIDGKPWTLKGMEMESMASP